MKKLSTQFILTALILSHFAAIGQKLSDQNFRYQYDPESEIKLNWQPFKNGNNMVIPWSVSKMPTADNGGYLLEWEKRKSYAEAEGEQIQVDTLSPAATIPWSGQIEVNISDEPWLLVAKVIRLADSKSWLYSQIIEKSFPVNGVIMKEFLPIGTKYIEKDKVIIISGSTNHDSLFTYRYQQNFPSAFPPYTEAAMGSDPVLLHDSTFTILNNDNVSFSQEGLYLVQSDTLSTEGFSFRVAAAPYPKYNRVDDLISPLIFIATREEYSELENANGDKTKFDKIILSITKDKDRARRFMRNYYQRVELANHYFASFKEGWKTDRGMIYIIFGIPDQVRLSNQREIWYYQDSRTNFVFVKKGSIYDPNYFVLDRDIKFTELWYSTIDLWRKGRF